MAKITSGLPMSVHLVLVTPDDCRHQIWMAATSRENAVDKVLEAIPEGWCASFLNVALTLHERSTLHMAAGELRQLR
jgi:hypothetical protein